eukprot:g8677.t1
MLGKRKKGSSQGVRPLKASKTQRLRALELGKMEEEAQERVEQLKDKAEYSKKQLRLAFRRQVNQLPEKARHMTLAHFIRKYGGTCSEVLKEPATTRQREKDKWVQATPRFSGRLSRASSASSHSSLTQCPPNSARQPRRQSNLSAIFETPGEPSARRQTRSMRKDSTCSSQAREHTGHADFQQEAAKAVREFIGKQQEQQEAGKKSKQTLLEKLAEVERIKAELTAALEDFD